jgi:hypothetical protein
VLRPLFLQFEEDFRLSHYCYFSPPAAGNIMLLAVYATQVAPGSENAAGAVLSRQAKLLTAGHPGCLQGG